MILRQAQPVSGTWCGTGGVLEQLLGALRLCEANCSNASRGRRADGQHGTRWRSSAEPAGAPVPSVPSVRPQGNGPGAGPSSPRHYPDGRRQPLRAAPTAPGVPLSPGRRSGPPSGRRSGPPPAGAAGGAWGAPAPGTATAPCPRPPPPWTATRRRWRRSWKVRVPRLGQRGPPAPGAAAGALGARGGGGGGRSWAAGVGLSA